MIGAIIVAFVVELARSHNRSPYGWLGAIAGLAYLTGIVVLRLRAWMGSVGSGALTSFPNTRAPEVPRVTNAML